jgi:energy-coupling factor transporter ATP-binding protein EcfA2
MRLQTGVIMVENIYYADRAADKHFFGRGEHIAGLERALTTGRRAIAAVMGGRGMGKSSLVQKIEGLLGRHSDVFAIRIDRPQSAVSIATALEKALGRPIDPDDPASSLLDAVRQPSAPRVVLLIDEVELALRAEFGNDLLENLRVAYDGSKGRLGVVIFGGSKLRQLLTSGASPFLRAAQWLPLRGLERGECREMLCAPLGVGLEPALCDTVWHLTNGHPLLIQRTMEDAVDRWNAGGGFTRRRNP